MKFPMKSRSRSRFRVCEPWAKVGSPFVLLSIIMTRFIIRGESGCTVGCDVALASYRATLSFDNTTEIGILFNISNDQIETRISYYNPKYTGSDMNLQGLPVNVSVPCDCINGTFLGYNFPLVYENGDFDAIASNAYSNLTTPEWLAETNPHVNPAKYDGSTINVIINCSCGDPSISMDYGFFMTYPLQRGDTLDSLSQQYNVPMDLLRKYNLGVDFTTGKGIVFLPVQDPTGSYHPFPYHMPVWKITVIAICSTLAFGVSVYIIYWCTNNWKKILDRCGKLCGSKHYTIFNGGNNAVGAISPSGPNTANFKS